MEKEQILQKLEYALGPGSSRVREQVIPVWTRWWRCRQMVARTSWDALPRDVFKAHMRIGANGLGQGRKSQIIACTLR